MRSSRPLARAAYANFVIRDTHVGVADKVIAKNQRTVTERDHPVAPGPHNTQSMLPGNVTVSPLFRPVNGLVAFLFYGPIVPVLGTSSQHHKS